MHPLEQHAIACARNVVEGFEFKFTSVLDHGRRVMHPKHASALHQLERALWALEEEDEIQ